MGNVINANNQVVVAYIRALVEGQPDLSLAAVQKAAGVKTNYLGRLEKGVTKEPSARVITRLIRAARGKLEQLDQLLDENATVDLAKSLAKEVLSDKGFTEEQRAFLENLTPEQKAALLAVARQMQQ